MKTFIILFCTVFLAPLGLASDHVVVVHPDTRVSDITFSKLVEYFKANKTRWEPKTKVYLVLPESKTPAHEFLLKSIYKMDSRGLAKHWIQQIYRLKITERPKQFKSTGIMIKILENKSGAIAILDEKDLPKGHGLKILTVGGKQAGDKGYALGDTSKKKLETGLNTGAMSSALSATVVVPAAFQNDDVESRLAAIEKSMSDRELADLLGGDSEANFLNGPILDLRGFGHVNLSGDDADSSDDGTENRFSVGGLDLFLSSRLSENITFLNETVFEPSDDGSYVLDVERVVLRYEIDDSLVIEAGRFHSKVGRWNELYHHGEFLQTSIGRPAVLNFEDENGLLPVHTVGVSLSGSQDLGGMPVEYTLEIGNGRGATPDPPQVVVDANDQKSINIALAISPPSIEGLHLGGSIYRDKIPVNTDAAAGALHGTIDETITNVFVEFERANWRVLAEFFDVQHDSAVDTSSTGWFMELSHTMGTWTPYLRLDGVDLDDSDLFFSNVDDTTTTVIGVRHALSNWSAINVQFAHTEIDLAAGGSDQVDSAVVQVSFGF